jgi:hypothetical protein
LKKNGSGIDSVNSEAIGFIEDHDSLNFIR